MNKAVDGDATGRSKDMRKGLVCYKWQTDKAALLNEWINEQVSEDDFGVEVTRLIHVDS